VQLCTPRCSSVKAETVWGEASVEQCAMEDLALLKDPTLTKNMKKNGREGVQKTAIAVYRMLKLVLS